MSPHGGQLRKPSAMITDSVTSPWSSSFTPRPEFFLLRWSHSPTPGHHLKLDNTIQVHGSSQEWLSCYLSRDASTTSVMAFLVLQGIRDCKRCSRKVKMVMWLNYFFIAVTKHPTWNNLVKEEFDWLVVWGFSSSGEKGMEREAAISCGSPSSSSLLLTQWTGSWGSNGGTWLAFSFSPLQSLWDPFPQDGAPNIRGDSSFSVYLPWYVLTDRTKGETH